MTTSTLHPYQQLLLQCIKDYADQRIAKFSSDFEGDMKSIQDGIQFYKPTSAGWENLGEEELQAMVNAENYKFFFGLIGDDRAYLYHEFLKYSNRDLSELVNAHYDQTNLAMRILTYLRVHRMLYGEGFLLNKGEIGVGIAPIRFFI